jgi:hypothetical protein
MSREHPRAIKSFGGPVFHVAARRGFAATILQPAGILIREKFQPDECAVNGAFGRERPIRRQR